MHHSGREGARPNDPGPCKITGSPLAGFGNKTGRSPHSGLPGRGEGCRQSGVGMGPVPNALAHLTFARKNTHDPTTPTYAEREGLASGTTNACALGRNVDMYSENS